ncbi:MAG: HlyD family secretion protein, partial [Marinicaulis sp.]|nr:HlyD family secretion protein [Marinicaulis sp.]
GNSVAQSEIATFLPTKETATQTIIARVPLVNPENIWIPGMTVRGDITVNEIEAPLAVRSDALQRFRDFTVVFEKVDETYEVRMLELGRQNNEWVEVLGGLEPGADYVAANSFLIKADIEKSGASHDH